MGHRPMDTATTRGAAGTGARIGSCAPQRLYGLGGAATPPPPGGSKSWPAGPPGGGRRHRQRPPRAAPG
eukprot:gene2632-biopygen15614